MMMIAHGKLSRPLRWWVGVGNFVPMMDGDSPLVNVFDGKLKLRLYLFFVHPRPVHWFMRLLKTT